MYSCIDAVLNINYGPLSPTLVEDPIPCLHMIPPHLRSNLPQQTRRYVQHG